MLPPRTTSLNRASRRAAGLGAALLAIGSAPALAAPTAPTVGLTISHSRAPYFVLHVTPGQTRAGSVTVQDVGRVGGGVTLYSTDATTGATSGAVYLSDQQVHHGVGTWITLDRSRLTLRPGQRVRVRFRVTVPADATPGEHLGGIVAAPDAPQTVVHRHHAAAAFGVKIREQSIIAVQADLPGATNRRLAITGVGTGHEGGDQTVAIGLANTGDLLTKGSGELVVRGADGTVRQRRSFSLDTFVPHTEIRYPVAVEGRALRPGRYSARVTIHWPGGSETRTLGLRVTNADAVQRFGSQPGTSAGPATSATSLLPWIVVAVLAAALLLTLGVVLGTRMRRRPAGA